MSEYSSDLSTWQGIRKWYLDLKAAGDAFGLAMLQNRGPDITYHSDEFLELVSMFEDRNGREDPKLLVAANDFLFSWEDYPKRMKAIDTIASRVAYHLKKARET